MSPEKFAFGVAVAVFAGGAIGLILQRLLHESFTTGGPRDMIGAVVGLLTLLSALVLGLLIWTAYGVYSGQNLAVQTLAAKVLQLDLALADYGPDATPVRAEVRQSLAKTIDQIWRANDSDADFVANNFAAAVQSLRNREAALAGLHPSTDKQKQALAAAMSTVEFDRSGAIADVVRARRPGFLSARSDGGRVGDASVLRLWSNVEGQRDVGCGRGGRRRCDFERRLSDPRPQRSVFRRIPRLVRAARAGAGGDGQGVRNLPPPGEHFPAWRSGAGEPGPMSMRGRCIHT